MCDMREINIHVSAPGLQVRTVVLFPPKNLRELAASPGDVNVKSYLAYYRVEHEPPASPSLHEVGLAQLGMGSLAVIINVAANAVLSFIALIQASVPPRSVGVLSCLHRRFYTRSTLVGISLVSILAYL
ncbi:hypothetical protein C7212DRAFT_336473 [Tuber magnatum]|uniref:Uncharacterized protein n=1 Tax=Tuber magnatum TaxID=42249 RepID=A0A317SEY9_9PEZI|nr:hypothetical protein C7212DRAFT_336473 [Tuber magnatum]